MVKAIQSSAALMVITFTLWNVNGVEAKRALPPEVSPLIYRGIKFIAPNPINAPEKIGYVEAWDVQANAKIWEKRVYHSPINVTVWKNTGYDEYPGRVTYIVSLSIENEVLIVTNQEGKKYKVKIPKDIFKE